MNKSLATIESVESKHTYVTPNTEGDGLDIIGAGKSAANGFFNFLSGVKNVGSAIAMPFSWLVYQGAKLTGNYATALDWADAAWVGTPQNKKSLIFADFAQKNHNRIPSDQLKKVESMINEASLSELLNNGEYDPLAIHDYMKRHNMLPSSSNKSKSEVISHDNTQVTNARYNNSALISTPQVHTLPFDKSQQLVSSIKSAYDASKGYAYNDASHDDLAQLYKNVNSLHGNGQMTDAKLLDISSKLNDIKGKVSSWSSYTGPSDEIEASQKLIGGLVSPGNSQPIIVQK